jgi:hypothetical protein
VTGHDFKYRGIDRELAASKPAGDRVWLVLNYDIDFFGNPHHSRDTARAVYGHGRHLIESQDFGVITVLLYARDETGGGTSARPVPQSPMSPQRAALKAPLLHVVKPCEEAFHSCSGGNSCAVCGRPLCHCVSDSICEAR